MTGNRSVQQFASPGWPAGYGSGLDCTWVITAPPGEKIELRFLPRSLLQRPDPDKSCKSDSVIIYDGRCIRICVSDTQKSVPFVDSKRLCMWPHSSFFSFWTNLFCISNSSIFDMLYVGSHLPTVSYKNFWVL